ncbi:hypothetical protein, partial [Streptomyces sp. YS-3]|uniref:hypothetical protein n=1 Tax=Streptomyces sp. YS-3 TaxID=3381352 RepID=UPI0038622E69
MPAVRRSTRSGSRTAVRARGAATPYGPDTPSAARLGIVDPTAKRLALARRAVAQGRPWRG